MFKKQLVEEKRKLFLKDKQIFGSEKNTFHWTIIELSSKSVPTSVAEAAAASLQSKNLSNNVDCCAIN